MLKDASATAIYGSRGANGVIVITTKAPAMGKLRVTYRGDLNLEVPDLNSYDVLNACQKLEIEKKAGLWSETNLTDLATYNKILNDINSGVNTDWLSQPLRVVSVIGITCVWREETKPFVMLLRSSIMMSRG